MTNRKLGDLLVAEGLITNLQLSIALAAQQTSSRRLGEILVERGFATEEQIAECLAAQYGYELADIDGVRPQGNAVSLLKADIAIEHAVLPLRVVGDVLECVMADPLDVIATDVVQNATKKRVSLKIAPQTRLLAKIRELYGLEEQLEEVIEGFPLPARYGSLRPRRKVGSVLLFDAVDHQLDRKVSLTAVAAGTDAERKQRWLIQAAARVPSPWVSAIYDWFEYEGNCWAVFERLEGESLAHVLRTRGSRTLTQAAELVAQIAEGVDHLHQSGGHCGLVCPENILVRPQGVLLTPFVEPAFEYRSPELEMGSAGLPASDVFALGTLLWECYSGENPHLAEAVRTGQRLAWADPLKMDVQTPPALVEVLTHALAKDPDDRYGSAVLLANTLRAYNWAAVLASQSAKQVHQAVDREQLLSVISQGEEEPTRRGFWSWLFGRQAA
ncbi:MAG: hypothetical protein IT363_15250 [Methanoregulaceae archaeon]|nr:hypothetical protein [Methanoregulaceae archaeon]